MHQDVVRDVKYSTSGIYMGSASDDHTISIRSSTNRALCTLTAHAGPVNAIAFSPDDKMLVSGSSDGTVIIWNLSYAAVRRVLSGHLAPVVAVAFAPNGAMVASSALDTTVRVWSIETGDVMLACEPMKAPMHTITFSPDSKFIIAGSADGVVRVWDILGNILQVEFACSTPSINCIACTPGLNEVAVGCSDGQVNVFSYIDGSMIYLFPRHETPVQTVTMWTPPPISGLIPIERMHASHHNMPVQPVMC